MKPRPFKTIYRRAGHSWKWMILSRWDDSEIASGQTLGIAAARAAVKKAHADLFSATTHPRSQRQTQPST